MSIEIRENASYYAWTVYEDDQYAGMIIREPSGGYTCPRGEIDSDKNFPSLEAAARALVAAKSGDET